MDSECIGRRIGEIGTLTPDDLMLIDKVFGKNSMFNSVLNELDTKLWKIKYDPTDYESYIKHYYKGDPQAINDVIAAMTQDQRVLSKMSTSAGFAQNRKFKSAAQAMELSEGKLMPVDDVLAAMGLRYMESWRVGLNSQMLGDLEQIAKDYPLLISKTQEAGLKELPGINLPKEIEFLDKGGIKSTKYINEKLYAHPEVAQQLKRLSDVFVDDRAFNEWAVMWDKATNIMKTLQTSANPGFTLRNLFGETLMNWMAGVKAESHIMAEEIMREAKTSRVFSMGNTYFVDGKPVINLEIRMEADITNLQSGINYEDIRQLPILENAVENFYKEGMTKFLNRTARELQSDICGFGTKVKSKFLTWKDWEDYKWLGRYKDSSFNVMVDVKVRRPGLLIRSIPPASSKSQEEVKQ
jgi:hypothetical protein